MTARECAGRADIILHEMSHAWFVVDSHNTSIITCRFGDLVTMEWWNGLWLKQSFATYMAALAVHEV